MRNLVLLALVAALITGCATVHVSESSASIPLNSLLQEADVNGVATWAILPPSYNSKVPAPWIIYNHGFGQTIASIEANAPQSLFVQSLASAGFVVVASEYRNLACWGNEQCAEDVANVQTLWRSQLNLWPRPFVVGESMGGIVTWDAISHGTLNPLAVVGIYPVCNLAAMYANSGFAPTIQTAYDFTSQAGYAAATRGFDPILISPVTFTGFPIVMWSSYSDQVVIRSQNEDPFAEAINGAGGSVILHTSAGNHGDPSNFDAPAVISFFSSVHP